MKNRKDATPQRPELGLALAFRIDRHVPSIAQLVERWTVVGNKTEIHRSLVQIQLKGDHFCLIAHHTLSKSCHHVFGLNLDFSINYEKIHQTMQIVAKELFSLITLSTVIYSRK